MGLLPAGARAGDRSARPAGRDRRRARHAVAVGRAGTGAGGAAGALRSGRLMGAAPDLERLRRLLSGEDTAWLLDRARRRLASGKPLSGVVTLASPSGDQRRAVERLLGRRAGMGSSLSVSFDELDAVLRRSGAAPDGFAEAVRLLVGAVPDRAAEAREWSAVYAPLDLLVAERPELAVWRAWLDYTGLVRRLASDAANSSALVRDAARVLRTLPSAGAALGRLPAETTGDAHGLDDGRPLATLTLSAARVL